MSKTKNMKISTIEEKVFKAFTDFENELTFDTFVVLCETLHKNPGWVIEETLSEVGHKLPVSELKKILEFIEGQTQSYCDTIGLSVVPLFNHYHCHESWKMMSDERLQCFMPYMGPDFWTELCEYPGINLRDPNDLSIEEMRAVFHGILK